MGASPERRRGFAQIRIGQQLNRVGEEWRLIFAAEERKSWRPSQMTVPQTVAPFLEHYLLEVRPLFPRANSYDALWLSQKGRPLSPDSISKLIARRTQAAFGHRIPPHRFRHCAASTIAVSAPSKIGLAPRLLDHASLKTTYDHYILARSVDASRHYAEIIRKLTPRRCRR